MTKQSIFDKNKVNNQCGSVLYLPESEKSMDEYAEQQSISFAEWIRDNGWGPNSSGLWFEMKKDRRDVLFYTTTELYQLFLQQQK